VFGNTVHNKECPVSAVLHIENTQPKIELDCTRSKERQVTDLGKPRHFQVQKYCDSGYVRNIKGGTRTTTSILKMTTNHLHDPYSTLASPV
jgi:hypothetical protein